MTRWRASAAALAALLSAPAGAQTLREAIAAAYVGNPVLADARARQDALAETPEAARALGRPTVAAGGAAGYDRLASGGTGSATASANVPLWTGGRVAAAVRAATGDVAAGAAALADIEAAVLEEVVAAYAALLFNQQAVEVARVGIERLDRQVAEAGRRFELGQATRTDVAQLGAQRASVVANLAEAEAALAVAAAAYRAVVGGEAGALATDVPPPAALPATRADAGAAAQAANPRIAAAARAVEAADARVAAARAERAPLVDLTGSYGRAVRLADGDLRAFPSGASALVGIRLPLLTGGLVPARVRQAQSLARAERFAAETARREAVRAADAAWARLAAARTRLVAAAEGLDAATLALAGVRAEYEFGLRSTIDILVADQALRAAQLAVAAARADALVAGAALLRATGRLGPDAYG